MEFTYIMITTTSAFLWFIFVIVERKKKLRSKKSARMAERLKEYEKAYYSEDFDETISTNRMNRLSKSKKAKKGGAKYNYRERTYYKILFLGSDTDEAKPLRINEMFERVMKALSGNESCTFEIKLRTKKADIIQEMAMHHPDVLHFAGHGDNEGRLCVHSDLGGREFLHPRELFANLSECCAFLQIVVLAACHSATQANEIARYINVVVCMDGEIAIDAMELFSKTFYAALTGGSSVQEAFDMGVAQLKMNMTQYARIPKLVVKEGLKAKNLMLISSYKKIKKEA